ncbi:MAG: hypothetical protein EOP85_10470 [Verrucomicrobiaceae bacterium]|nr:MAG: hypothetical protein EOP85_10470 [Verrucomicrobiaceae bacterium]
MSIVSLLAAGGVHAETHVRSVVLEVRRDDAPEVRARLNHKTNGLQVATIDGEAKAAGVRKVMDFSSSGPWGGGTVEMKGSTGNLDFNGQKRDLEVSLDIMNPKAGRNGISQSVSSYFELLETTKSTRSYWGDNRGVTVASGRWQEMTMWSDSKYSVMLWQFVSADPATGETSESTNLGMLEIRFYQATAEDIEQLGKSKPETREKAIAWLAGRAKPWQESRMLIADGQDSSYMFSDGDYKIADGETYVESDSLSIVAKLEREGGQINLTCEIGAHYGQDKGQKFDKTITGKLNRGIWDFQRIEGCKSANLVVYRLETP